MALLTVHLNLVSPYGDSDIPTPASGKVEFTPVTHGKYQSSLRAIETIVASINNGVMTPVELTPAEWYVTITPLKGAPWPRMMFNLQEGMPEPVNLANLVPDLVIEGEKWAKGDPGESAYQTAVDNGFVGTEQEWLASLKGDPGDDSTVPGPATTITIADVITLAPGEPATAEMSGESPSQSLTLGIPQGPKGDPSTVPGPANSLSIGTVTTGAAGTSASATVSGTAPSQTLSLTIPRGDTGLKGDPGNLGTMMIYGAGRPDNSATMTTETAASVAAAPSGAKFICTDSNGAGVGAWEWTKRGSTWVVTYGDTGWRDMTSIFQSICDNNSLTYSTSAGFSGPRIRRTTHHVDFNIGISVTGTTGLNSVDFKTAFGVGTLFTTAISNNYQIPSSITGSAGVIHWANNTYVRFWTSGNQRLIGTWQASGTWPSSLPGAAA